jgi:hypothetical protein
MKITMSLWTAPFFLEKLPKQIPRLFTIRIARHIFGVSVFFETDVWDERTVDQRI